MSVQTGEAVPSGPASRRIGDRARFRMDRWRTDPNPIWIRELKQAVRLARTPVILCVLTVLMTMLIAGIGGLATAESSPSATGIILFHVYFSFAYFVVTLVGPTVAANGIAAEREGRTWEAVLLTGLEPGTISRGKFLAAYTTISLYIIMLAPVGALPFLFGGVTATETIVAFLFLFLIALMSVAFGLAISSKMTSMRGAIAVTLLLALPFSILTFVLFGPTLSIAAHKAWPTVPEGPPIWLPTAYSRAPFDAAYVFSLVVAPILSVSIPSWFMYEVTIANLTSVTDDRSTGLKRWFVFSMPVLIGAAVAPIVGAASPSDTFAYALLSIGVFFVILTFCIYLFQGDAIGPSRRVTAHWNRLRAGSFARFLGPSLVGTAFLQLVFGAVGFGVITAVGTLLVNARTVTATSLYTQATPEQVLLFGLSASGFFVFMLGFGTFARSRSSGAMIARLILAGTVLGLAITPWVVAAIVGVFGSSSTWNEDLFSIAAPSPVFVFFAMSKLSHGDMGSAPAAAAFCAVGYWLVGLLCLLSAKSRCTEIIRKHETTLAETDRLLALEDEAVVTARAEAEAARAAAFAAASAAAATASSTAVAGEAATTAVGAAGVPVPEPQPS
jgi:hypothetical protein